MGFWKYVLGTPRNYALTILKVNERELDEKQRRIKNQLFELSRSIKLYFLTPSVYEE